MTLQNVQLTNSGNSYYAVLSNSYGSVTSSIAYLHVGYPPVIVEQPISVRTPFGGSVSLTCVVTGTPPIAFQWLECGVPLAGKTNATLEITNLQSVAIQLRATNAYGFATSANTVNPYMASYPSNLFQGLIAYYPFDGNANDESGNSNNISLTGQTFMPDNNNVPDKAIHFTPYQPISIPNSETQYFTSISVALWVNVDSNFWTINARLLPTGQQNPTDWAVWEHRWDIEASGSGISATNSGWQAYLGGGNRPFAVTPTTSTLIVPNQWVHLCMTCDNKNATIYVNGIPATSASYTDMISWCPYCTANQHVTIGGVEYTNYSTWYGGIDQFRLYNRALSLHEVSQIYALESQIIPPQNLSVSPVQNSTLQVQLFGTPNYPYVLQVTTNLTPPINWQSVNTNTADTYGKWTFTDSNTAAYPARFYRAMIPTP